MKGKLYLGVFLAIFFIGLLSSIATAEVLIMNLNSAEYSAGESAKVFGYVLENNLDGSNNTAYTINLNGVLEESNFTNADGYYEHYITNVTAGNHTVNVTTSNSQQILTFTVFAPTAKPSYKVIAPSLVVPYRNTTLDFTIKKYLGSILTNDTYSYTIYYENGTAYSSSSGVSGVEETVTLPQRVGLYKIKVDNKKSFTISVAKFSMKYKITDKSGNPKSVFKPSGVAYFQVEGFSNGQKITNATVSALVRDPTGSSKTVSFLETNGLYKGNTNVTQSGTPMQLRAGDYQIVFTMRDSSNNEQTLTGFFTVLGLGVDVELLEKKPYRAGDDAELDVTIRNQADGTLIEHGDVTYTFELEKDGLLYDVAGIATTESVDSTLTSDLVFTIPPGLEDGGYFLRIKANSDGKIGKGSEYIEIANTDVFIDLKDNYGAFRDIFEPGEGVTVSVESPDTTLQLVTLEVLDGNGAVNLTTNSTINDTSGTLLFTAPDLQGNYLVKVAITTDGGTTVYRDRWFKVQNYFSYLNVKDLNNNFQFIQSSGGTFLGEIAAFDITTGSATDLSGFTVLFNKIVNEETQQQYTNMQTRKNLTYSYDSTGIISYEITPPNLPNGIYRIDYTLVDSAGTSFSGSGWFGISAFDIQVLTYNTNGQQRSLFAAGNTINITIQLSSPINGTAKIHRDFFDEKAFNVVNGVGSTTLTAAQSELPSQSGFYNFGVEVETEAGETGLGNGFFEIRNLNIKSITVTNQGEYASSDNIVATVVVEKSGILANNTNVTLARVIRSSDGYDISSEFSGSTSPLLTNNQGSTTLTLTHTDLEPGNYFVEIRARKDGNTVFNGFGFQVVEDSVSISIDGDSNEFTRNNQAVDIRVTVTAQDTNNTPRENVTVNLTGLLRFDTWSTVFQNKQAVTNSNGVATITYTTNNQTPLTKYAPVIRVAGVTETIVGFGNGEFEVIPFNAGVRFGSGSDSYVSGTNVAINVTGAGITSSATASCTVRDMSGTTYPVECSPSAYNSATKVLTLTQDLDPGEYFADIVITQGSTTTKTLWFEIISPWMHLEPFTNPNYADDDTMTINYTVFTFGVSGWLTANATVNITSIENMWTGNTTVVGDLFNASGFGTEAFDLTPYSLSQGDYFLNFEIIENPDFENTLYFRIDNNVMIIVEPIVNGNNVTINFTTSGVSGFAEYYLDGYMNFDSFDYTSNPLGTGVLATGANAEFDITGLENGFYQANVRIVDGSETFYWDAYFEIRDLDVIIVAPMQANVGTSVQFNITNNGADDETFWIIDPFTQSALYTQIITSSETTNVTFTFNYGGWYIYSYGDNMWDAFPNSRDIQINQAGLNVQWPWQNNNYVLSENRNFTFNVTADAGYNMTLKFMNHFNGNQTTVNLGESTGSQQEFSFNLETGLNLLDGPHDIKLTLLDGSDYQPKEFFFIHLFKSNYDIQVWNQRWDYDAGEAVELFVDVYNVSDFWNRVNADSIEFVYLNDQFGSPINPKPNIALTSDTATFNTSSVWTSGNYHGEVNVTVLDANKVVPIDFYLRGNDNLEVFWWQNQWDYSMSDIFELTIETRNAGAPASGIPVSLVAFEQWTENWNETPTSFMDNVSDAYYFSTANNLTGASGSITFYINLSQTTLETGGYSGRLNVGGRVTWFDFQVRTYMVDAWTDGWDYGITDTITMNVWAKNLDDWSVITENGTVTISEIRKHNPGSWESVSVPLTAFGIDDAVYTVINGNAVIELLPNQTALNLTQMSEFEVKLAMDLDSSQGSEGWGWFQLRTGSRPGATIVDGTGEVPEFFFADQKYTLQVTGVTSATLQNIWGPMSQNYNEPLLNISGTFKLNFTTPSFPGWYSMDIQATGADGYPEYMYKDFIIGSGTEMNAWMSGGNSVVPGVNFTVRVDLFGEGEDPWCPDCGWTWFGPLANETIYLSGIKDLQTFNTRNVSYLDIYAVTDTFSDSMLGNAGSYVDCTTLMSSDFCGNESSCVWTTDPWDQQSQVQSCRNLDNICGAFTENQTACENLGCTFDQFGCFYDTMGDEGMDMGPPEEMSQPGLATFNLHPTTLNLTPGDSYELIFEYTDNEGGITQEDLFIQVEKFHVAISRNEQDLEPGSTQWVWLMTSDLYGNATSDCNISFSGLYNEKDYQLIDDLAISGATNENGTFVFQYEAPSAPGFYFVEGLATCAVDNEQVTQSIAYFVDVGSKGLEVDMKTKFEPGENILISVTTADRFGDPAQQELEFSLFYDADEGANASITRSPTSLIDCTPLTAATYENGPGMENSLYTSTDSSGIIVLELCPMPQGEYSIDIFPMMNMMNQEPMSMGGGNFGYFADFVVGRGDMEIMTELTYQIGDEVNMTVNVTDGDGIPVNGTLIMMDAIMEPLGGHSFSEVILYEDGNITNKLNVSVVNGIGMYNFTIPAVGYDEDSGNATNISIGPVDVFAMVQGNDGYLYSKAGIQFAIISDVRSSVSVDSTVGVNELIDIHVETKNDARYKAQMGVFFMKDNSANEEFWIIEGGVFLFNNTAQNASVADFQILSPKEPGDYFLGIPIYTLETSPKNVDEASEMLITPINVRLESVNVSGHVKYHDSELGVYNALVQIGQAEVYTDSNGDFALEVAKGEKKINVEKRIGDSLKYFIKSDEFNFVTNVDELNITLYRANLTNGVITPALVIINQSTNLSTLRINVSTVIQNNMVNSVLMNFTNISYNAKSENITIKNVLVADTTVSALVEPKNTTGNDYEVVVRLKNNYNNWSSYVDVDGTLVEALIGTKLVLEYNVSSTIVGEEYDAWCGDNICDYATEFISCPMDCAAAESFCGDNVIDEPWEDCEGANLGGYNCTNMPSYLPDFGFTGGTLGCFPASYGHMACLFDFQNCTGGDGGQMGGLDPHLTIVDRSAYNNDTLLHLAFDLDDLSGASYCGGSSPGGVDEYEEWTVGIDSKVGGCDDINCWGQEDYVVYLSMNDSGDLETGYEYWNGTDLVEEVVTVTGSINCAGDNVSLYVALNDVNASCDETVNFRFETWFSDDFADDMEDSNVLSGYTVSCEGGAVCGDSSVEGAEECDDGNTDNGDGCSATCMNEGGEPGFDEIQFAGVAGNDNGSRLFVTASIINLSAAPFCPPDYPNLPEMTDFRSWDLMIDSLPGTGCDYNDPIGECTNVEDYVVAFETNATGGQTIDVEYWNGSDLDIYSGASDYEVSFDCSADEIYYNISFNEMNISVCQNISLRMVSWSGNVSGDNDSIGDVSSLNYTVECGGPQPGLDGNISGSVVANATIRVYNSSNDELVANITSDENADFSTDLAPGIYYVEIDMPADFTPYQDMVIDVENINITGRETLYVSIPHISGIPMVNDQPITGLVEIANGTPMNISMFINNTDDFVINVTFQVNATNIGDNTVYEDQSAVISGSSINSALMYEITPTIPGFDMAGLIIDLELELPASQVILGSVATDSSLRVALDNIMIPVNVSGGVQAPQPTGLFLTVEHNSLPYQNAIIFAMDGHARNTDANGEAFINWTPGMHTLQVDFSDSCIYDGSPCVEAYLDILLQEVNITGLHNLTIDAPHIAFDDAVGDMLINEIPFGDGNNISYYISNGEDLVLISGNNYNFSVQIENLDTFIINALMSFYVIDTDGNWGGQSIFNDTATINPSQTATLTVPFIPTSAQSPRFANVYDAGFEDYLVEFDVGPDSNVITNTNVEYDHLSVVFDMGSIPFNMTGGS